MTVFPHWGGQDGGWAEGISYGMAYNGIFITPLESMRIATGIDLWQRPFFGKVRYFFLYNVTPRGEIAGFGDSYDKGVPGRAGGLRGLLQFHAERFDDPTVRGWLELLRVDGKRLPDLPSMPGLILPQTVEPKLPLDLPPDAAFHGVGWAALHSDLSDPENDLFVSFKSSPYGGVSHSYCDQNGFAILKGAAHWRGPAEKGIRSMERRSTPSTRSKRSRRTRYWSTAMGRSERTAGPWDRSRRFSRRPSLAMLAVTRPVPTRGD